MLFAGGRYSVKGDVNNTSQVERMATKDDGEEARLRCAIE